jgi:murein DD-endopeptidase MepM/ murein hydrolase activator NlpD
MVPPSTSHALSRRSMLRGAVACAVCLGAGGASRLLPAHAADGSVASLDGPGSALVPAERLALRAPDVPPGQLLFPVDAPGYCYVLDNYGAPRGSRLHEGVDIMSDGGNVVFAVADGVLTKRYTNTGTAGWGWTLYDDRTDTRYQYFHLTADTNALAVNDRVSVGDVIGFVGDSGTSSGNFHLHFEVRPDGGRRSIDPLPLLFVDPTGCRVSPPIR